jgi:hypothetical protein
MSRFISEGEGFNIYGLDNPPTIGMSIVPLPITKLIQVVEYRNPEIILPKLIEWYFQELDLQNLHPNFPTIRVGNTHPFATLLYQDVYGQQLDLSVFPSITLIDSSTSQTAMEVGNGNTNGVLNANDGSGLWQSFRAAIVSGQFLTSPANLALLDAAMLANDYVTFVSTRYITTSTIDCNIWTENKDLTSELYDICTHYFIDNKIALDRDQGLQILEGLSGRRSGDINLDFGKLLYGANITVPMNIQHHSYNFDVSGLVISDIEVSPTFEELL